MNIVYVIFSQYCYHLQQDINFASLIIKPVKSPRGVFEQLFLLLNNSFQIGYRNFMACVACFVGNTYIISIPCSILVFFKLENTMMI